MFGKKKNEAATAAANKVKLDEIVKKNAKETVSFLF
jgi:hypothetical protein